MAHKNIYLIQASLVAPHFECDDRQIAEAITAAINELIGFEVRETEVRSLFGKSVRNQN